LATKTLAEGFARFSFRTGIVLSFDFSAEIPEGSRSALPLPDGAAAFALKADMDAPSTAADVSAMFNFNDLFDFFMKELLGV
jgi:hypothetical protein